MKQNVQRQQLREQAKEEKKTYKKHNSRETFI